MKGRALGSNVNNLLYIWEIKPVDSNLIIEFQKKMIA
jgi:hypothetical protein